jgi:malate synthase
MPQPNQYGKQLPEVRVTARDLLDFKPEGPITEAGLRNNVQVGIQYIGSWLGGNGCVPIFNLMEDAATAEISRSQVWQWIRSPKGVLADGRKVTKKLFQEILADELKKTPGIVGEEAYASGKYEEGARLFEKITSTDEYVEFLTLPAYGALP